MRPPSTARRSRRRCRRAAPAGRAWTASGSTSRPISCAMSASLGSVSDERREGRIVQRLASRKAPSAAARPSRSAPRPPASRRSQPHEEAQRHGLRRLPAVERVGVVPQQRQQLVVREIERDLHRRREAAEQRRDRRRRARPRRSRCRAARVEHEDAVGSTALARGVG